MLKMMTGKSKLSVKRSPNNPIIYPDMAGLVGEAGSNINGPSLIRVPAWIDNPLGQYYLYFSHHAGTYIRLAYADRLEGPWKIHEPGTLQLHQTDCQNHIASPDVHVDEKTQTIRMYFHGVYGREQVTMLATSQDGLNFTATPEVLGPFYFRVFQHEGWYYAVAKNKNEGGILLRSLDGITPFESGPSFIPRMRHAAIQKQDKQLLVFYSRIGDAPESILMSHVNLEQNWQDWSPTEPIQVIEPEMDYEGVALPISSSTAGAANYPMHQLRDPALYTENDTTYLLYSVAGEQGIGIAQVALSELFPGFSTLSIQK